MLAIFDAAKRELKKLRSELATLSTQPPTSETVTREEFLKVRALDRLHDVYFDSKATLEHIDQRFKNASTDDVLTTIDQAIQFAAPLRRALGSEEDNRTVQALVDAAVWRSKFVWTCGLGALIAMAVALGLLGVSIAGLNKQADAARQFFEQTKNRADEANKKLSDGLTELQRMTEDFEKKRKEVNTRIDQLFDPESETSKVVKRFQNELARLREAEQAWTTQRDAIASKLTLHDKFLGEKETEITNKATGFNQLVSRQISDIEAVANNTRAQEANSTSSAAAAKKSADSTTESFESARINDGKLQGLLERANEIDKSIVAIKATIETAQNDVGGLRTQILTSSADAQVAKAKADEAARSAADVQHKLERSLALSQQQAEDRLGTIQTYVDSSNRRATDVFRVADETITLKTDVIGTIEDLKTKEQKLSGQLDRLDVRLGSAVEIIRIVDDKRADITQKLHALLDERPSLEFASFWKLAAVDTALRWLFGTMVVALIALTVWLAALSRQMRRAKLQLPTDDPITSKAN